MSVESPEAVDSGRSAGDSPRSIVEDLRESASVESVYGEPIESHGKTVIPLARVGYGFVGGFGRGGDEDEESGEGAGGGGGASAKPSASSRSPTARRGSSGSATGGDWGWRC